MPEKPSKEEWAIMVNVTEPVKDFHKRVPDMAHKVSAIRYSEGKTSSK